MIRKKRAPIRTALDAFEKEKGTITYLVGMIQEQMRHYDQVISTVPGGHQDWSHAGTMTAVREHLEAALQSIDSASMNTRQKASRHASK